VHLSFDAPDGSDYLTTERAVAFQLALFRPPSAITSSFHANGAIYQAPRVPDLAPIANVLSTIALSAFGAGSRPSMWVWPLGKL
jgi:hypothetical protein